MSRFSGRRRPAPVWNSVRPVIRGEWLEGPGVLGFIPEGATPEYAAGMRELFARVMAMKDDTPDDVSVHSDKAGDQMSLYP